MTQEVEIEFKSMLTKDEYEKLIQAYKLEDRVRWQANDYFDTPTFQLKKQGAALRIREKKHGQVLTLKQPNEVGLLETHASITEEEAEDLFKYGIIHDDQMKQALAPFQLNAALEHLGRLETNRAEHQTEDGLLVLDESHYLETTDYEIEFEVTNEEAGKRAFERLLAEHGLPYRPAKNKIVRFMELKMSRSEG
ncbi:CYTH domain-containing protein [Exiguobacterium sp. B2(2022)]|uniref:CYTH domain-containing protein n=1 Tax=Exiguobacterium sp. B2(2022) TaxID=2992755 RepID=UPI00237A6402|nr:CYTH domain-containing protein [Exiguobacterium sp. B2(2022)]MDE0563858.1 CYTH domain-containing protein [Exiguobacterium sp. B2(2022)]